jgi:hypothetical protein
MPEETAVATIEPPELSQETAVAVLPAPESLDLTAIERVIVLGDLSKLSPVQRWDYYKNVCLSVGLNPFTQPFAYLTLNGKLVLYALKGATDQLRKLHNISITGIEEEEKGGLYYVTVFASQPDPNGGEPRRDADKGIVALAPNLAGEARANQILKAISKAKRRVTLAMCGLGMLDETETEHIPGAVRSDIPAVPPFLYEPDDDYEAADDNLLRGQQRRDAARSGGQPMRTQVRTATVTEMTPEQQQLRRAGERRYVQLAAHAAKVGHPSAQIMQAQDPKTMTNGKLIANLNRLEELFPNVPEEEQAGF